MPSESFPVSGPVQSSVHLALADVSVTTDQSGQASASVEPGDPDDRAAAELAATARISFDAGELRVVVPDRVLWRTSPASLKVRLTVPEGSSFSAAAGVLTLQATGRLDDVSLKTGVATVELEHAASFTVRGGTATVELGSAGSVEFKVGRGDLRIGAVEDAYIKVAQGRVEIGSSTGEVLVKGAMASIDIAEASKGHIRFETAMGSARIGVVEGTTVELDLSSTTGDARSELEPTGEPAGREADLRVRLKTTSGDVVVARAAAHASAAG